jgi:hypothetical protein
LFLVGAAESGRASARASSASAFASASAFGDGRVGIVSFSTNATDNSQGIFSMSGRAKSRMTHDSRMAVKKRSAYVRRAERLLRPTHAAFAVQHAHDAAADAAHAPR